MFSSRAPGGSPDMILNAFLMKFDDKKNEILARACKPPKRHQKQNGARVQGQRSSKMKEKIVISRAPGRFPK